MNRGLLTCLAALLALPAWGQTYDLAADWSDASNPNGPWQYRGGNLVLPTNFPNWGAGGWPNPQPMWAQNAPPNSPFIPAWGRSVNNTMTADPTWDAPVGTVFTHGTDAFSGNDALFSNVLWTSPVAGSVTVSGGTWLARKSLARSGVWSILVNGNLVTDGALASNDAFTSANPFQFQNGSGGAGVLSFDVNPGDTVEYRFVRTSAAGEFAALNLSIAVVPEPATLALAGTGLVGSLVLVKRRSARRKLKARQK